MDPTLNGLTGQQGRAAHGAGGHDADAADVPVRWGLNGSYGMLLAIDILYLFPGTSPSRSRATPSGTCSTSRRASSRATVRVRFWFGLRVWAGRQRRFKTYMPIHLHHAEAKEQLTRMFMGLRPEGLDHLAGGVAADGDEAGAGGRRGGGKKRWQGWKAKK